MKKFTANLGCLLLEGILTICGIFSIFLSLVVADNDQLTFESCVFLFISCIIFMIACAINDLRTKYCK